MDRKKNHRLLMAVVLCGLISPLCLGQNTVDVVRQRLKEIKAEDGQAAQVAELELMAMGEKAIEPLWKIIDSGAPEREEASRVYLAVLEKTGLITQVTLNFENAPLKEIIAELNRQAGKEVVVLNSALNNERVTIHREKVPFTLALAELCHGVDGAVFSDITKSKGVLAKAVGSRRRPVAEEFGVVALVNSIQWSCTLNYGGHPMQAVIVETLSSRTTDFSLDFHMLEDPKRQALFTEFQEVEALEQKGNKVERGKSSISAVSSDQTGLVNNFRMSFEPAMETVKFARLRGKMNRYVGYELETWEIGDPSKAQGLTREFGPTKLEIRKVTVNATTCSIEGVWTGVPAPKMDIERKYARSVLESLARWFSVDGDTTNSVSKNNWMGTADASAAAGTYGGTFKVGWRTSDKAGFKDVKIKATVPRKFTEMTSAFEFKDVELP